VTTPVDVILPKVSATDLASAGATAGDVNFTLNADCPSGLTVYMTLTDAQDPANRTSTLNLDPSSTAKNVGLQVMFSGAPVKFGPDSSVKDNANQFRIGVTGGGSASMANFTARYISTGAATAGTVKAAATFAMSYQ